MISGLNLDATVDYTLKEDTENPTVWKLGVLPSSLFSKIASNNSSEAIGMAYELLSIGIKGWENFSVPFRTETKKLYGREVQVVPIELLDMINTKDIGELSRKLIEVNGITEAERKN